MNEQERSELERLKLRQTRLAQELAQLATHLNLLEQRLNLPQPAAPPPVAVREVLNVETPPATQQPVKQPVPAPPVITPLVIPPAPIIARNNVPPIATSPTLATAPATKEPGEKPVPPVAEPSPPQRRVEIDVKDFLKGVCRACGGPLEFPASAVGDTIPCPHCGKSTVLAAVARPIPAPPPITAPIPTAATQPVGPPALPKAAPAAKGSFEMRLGTYWLPRIGIVIVLTALVFFGNLAYQDFISKLGPGGKVSLLYLASAVLLVAGGWWQRKAAKESLKNYAQVLFAGGLAAVYFTTYAAHHIENLRIIESPGLDGGLLLAWAGFMVWVSDRKKSEVLALFAVGLAYYTSIITRVGLFTLYSNLVLTAAAVFFLVRNRWAGLTFASLIATYAGYAFWRFFNGSEWHWASPEEGLWTGTWFLVSYWLLFTAAVFLSKDQKFAGPNRAGFLTLNNGAFFTGFLLTMLQVRTGGFWQFALIYGSGLLVLAEAARRFLASEPLAKNAYLTQGLLLVTVGFISKYSGLQLALILAAESVVLLVAAQQRKSRVLLAGACIAAGLAVGWGIGSMEQTDRAGLWLGLGLGALMLVNTLLAHRHTSLVPQAGGQGVGPLDAALGIPSAGAKAGALRPRWQPSYFTALAFAVWFVATWNYTVRVNAPLALATEAALFILSIYLLGVPEISLLGHGYLLAAQGIWVYDAFAGTASLPGWSLVSMMVLAIGLREWWRRQKVLDMQVLPDPDLKVLLKLSVVGKNLVLLASMHIAVVLAGGWDLAGNAQLGASGIWLPMGLGALMLADALLAHRHSPAASAGMLRPQVNLSTVLALVVWLAVTWHGTAREHFPLVLAAEALLLTFSFYLLRVPEIPLLSQGYTVLAQAAWVGYFVLEPGRLPPWWNPVLLIAITLVLSHWWQRQKFPELHPQFGLACQGVYALAIVGVIYGWLAPKTDAGPWLVVTSLLAVGITAYGVFTRAWLLAACGQIFMVVSAVQFALQLGQSKPAWALALAPMAALGLLSWSTVAWFQRKPDASGRVNQPLLQVAMVYRWVALVMSIWWVCAYIPERERIWLLALLGLGVFLWAGWQRNQEALLFSAAFTLVALVFFWLPLLEAPRVYLPNLIVLLLLLAQRQIACRLPERYPIRPEIHTAVILIGGFSLWRFLSLWVLKQQPEGFYLTASWSMLALAFFTAGIALRERIYRYLGLGVLACALGRVVIFDVWKLQTLYRILSFMALGIVLLVLGFIYNRYQEKIREWL
jgi:uncharacterized membrane protein